MQYFKRGLMVGGALALAAMLLTLFAPKSVHAAVATLVQVANTIGNPAITQDTSRTAAQYVGLTCSSATNYRCTFNGSDYSIPSDQYLMITSIMITPAGGGSGQLDVNLALDSASGATSNPIQTFRVSNTVTTQFQYPSAGIGIFSSGFGVAVWPTDGNTTTKIYLAGYTTRN